MAGMSSLTRVSCSVFCLAVFGVGIFSSERAWAVDLASHKAIYDIRMVSAKNGSQVIDVRGKMLYTVRKSCDGWISDHKFNLDYEYSGAPPVEVDKKFASFESFDGKTLNFSSSQMNNGEFDRELRGMARISGDGKDAANFTIPDNLSFKLTSDTVFPAGHTIKLIEAAQKNQKLMSATVFDGSDETGSVEINAVIGKKILPDDKSVLDKTLMGVSGWSMRLAVFHPEGTDEQAISDYEMSMELLENGIVRNMKVDYRDFSVSQKLVAIEPVKTEECGVE